jgi:hypothetical protein
MTTQTEAPVHVIHLGAQGEPTLLISTTSNYTWLYNDKGSGADMDVTIWRPTPTNTDYYIIGDYAQGNYSQPTGSSLIVMALNDDPNNPLIKAPVGYTEVWNDHGSGGDNDGSVWFPVPPDGYISIGFLGQTGYNAPSPKYACLRRDLVQQTQVGTLIWSDKGSGANGDVALYSIVGVPNAFVAQANYNPYNGSVYQIKGAS